ncbi:hypothetical protein ACR6C2_07565 [Streptomyces sp. INA 01156]
MCATLAETAMAVDGQPGCPCVTCVVPGTPAWDSCDGGCEGGETPGQLTVHYSGMVPTSNFPQETRDVIGSKNCLPVRAAAEYVITLLRCAPSPARTGVRPPARSSRLPRGSSRWTRRRSGTRSRAASRRPANRRGQTFVMGQQRTIGPEGGCVGVEQRVTVALPSCPCPEGESL